MRRSRISVLAASVGLALCMTACGGGGGGARGDAQLAAAAAPASFSVTLTEFKIDPAMIDAPSGAALTFEVKNAGTVQHSFAVKAGDQTYATPMIDAGKTATLQVPALGAGNYEYLCTVTGHADLGMKGTLMVADATAGVAAAASPSAMASMTAVQMAQSHKAGVDAFVAQLKDGPNTKGTGNQVLAPTMHGDVKTFRLIATQLRWEVSPGQFVDAMAFNGQIPGPEIRVRQGDHVRVQVENQMDQPLVVHFHGMTVPNAMDGVPFITQDPIMPGQSWTYAFTVVDPPGFYVYHSHFNSTEQVGKGLYGAFMVLPKSGSWRYPSFTIDPMGYLKTGAPATIGTESTLFLGDGPLGYNLNAKSFPATEPIMATRDDWVLIHLANEGSMLHPMHLHGYHFEVVAQDGFPLDQPYMADTLVIAPGQRFDVLVHAVYPGVWAFHCHILPHVEGPEGMYGMVTALIVS